MLSNIITILAKDLKVELRQPHTIGGIALFAVTLVFVVVKAFNNFTAFEWSLLLWIMVLFAGLNAIVKSFVQEDSKVYTYYKYLLDPLELIIAKMVYNFILTSLLFSIILLMMLFFGGNPIRDMGLFITGSLFGLLGISTVFTLVSSIASAGSNVATLMSILSLPLILPILLSLIKITAVSFGLIADSDIDTDILLLLGIDGLLIGIGLLLFPVIWKA